LSTDLQGIRKDIGTDEFWKWVLAELSGQLQEALCTEVQKVAEGKHFDFFTLRPLFEKLRSKKIIFVFDEFETILENHQFTESFYGLLRYLAENCSVAFVTATRKELVYHCIDNETKTSPFFNIFDTLILRPFQESECRELVNSYLKDSEIHFIESEVTQLIELSGSYPAFFQMGCSFLFDAYQTGEMKEDTFSRWSYVEDNFRIQMNSHAAYFWNKSEEEEKILLALFALLSEQKNQSISEEKISKLYPRYKNDLLALYSRSLVLKDTGGYRLFSPLFAEWVLIELTDISKPAEQSLEEWLTEYDKNTLSKISDKIEDEFRKVNPKYWGLLRKTLLLVKDPKPILDIIDEIV